MSDLRRPPALYSTTMETKPPPPPDTLNQRLGVLNRREAEARILQAFLNRLEDEFEAARVREVLRETIITIAHQQGAAMAREQGDDSLPAFADTLPAWKRDGALEIEELERSEDTFHFNVTRCRYAELYRALGIPELGALLSCNRDFALIEGYVLYALLIHRNTISALRCGMMIVSVQSSSLCRETLVGLWFSTLMS